MAHRGTVESAAAERGGGGGGGGGDGGCKPREENNNEVDALSKELSGMGCIVDAARASPALCEDGSVCGDSRRQEHDDAASDEEAAYLSEEFDASGSEAGEEAAGELAAAAAAGRSAGRATRSGGDARTTPSYGSPPVPQTRRANMSFSNTRLRDIERENRILLDKILSARGGRSAAGARRPLAAAASAARAPPPAPASYARRQLQRRIDHDNLILLRKIQRAKSSSCSVRR